MGILDGGPHPQGEGKVLWVFDVDLFIFAIVSLAEKRVQFVWENMIRFPFGQYIVGNVCLLALVTRSKLGFMRNLQKC